MLKRRSFRTLLVFATICGALFSALPALATDFDSTVTEHESPSGKKMYRWEVTNSETGKVSAWGITKSKRKAKKQAKEKEEEFEEISGGSVVSDDDFGCEILDSGNPECG